MRGLDMMGYEMVGMMGLIGYFLRANSIIWLEIKHYTSLIQTWSNPDNNVLFDAMIVRGYSDNTLGKPEITGDKDVWPYLQS